MSYDLKSPQESLHWISFNISKMLKEIQKVVIGIDKMISVLEKNPNCTKETVLKQDDFPF